MHTKLRWWALLLVAAPGPALARDTNPEGVPVGHRAIGLGGAYTAVTGDGVSLWYNPAGLGALARKGISANVTLYQWRSQEVSPFVNFGSDLENTPGIRTQGDGKAESSDFTTIPSSLVVSLPLGGPEGHGHHGIAGGLFVPDADSYVAKTDRSLINPGVASAQLKARDILDERSYWVGAGYGYDAGDWAIGFSAFGVAHLFQRSVVASIVLNEANMPQSVIDTRELDTTDVTAVVELGGLYEVSPQLQLGLSVRSPSLGRLYSKGDALSIRGSEFAEDGRYLDRLETDDLKAEHRLPVKVDAGVSWHPSDRFLLTFDVHFSGPLAHYKVFSAPLLCPLGTDGQTLPCDPDAERTIDLSEFNKRDPVVNFAVGSEIGLSDKLLLRLGAYTDFSAVHTLNEEEPLEARVDVFSGVLGVGYLGERGSTDIGLLVRRGVGDTVSPFNSSPRKPQATVTQIGVYLAGSANL